MMRDKEGHYIMIKGSIQEEDVTILNIYAPNTGAPQYVRQMLTNMKGEINSNTIIVRDLNTPLTPRDRSTKQKISKETQTLNYTMDQLDLTFSQRSLRLSSFPLILFYFFFSASFISTILSSTSLILSSASVILLLVPPRVLLISVIALFTID